jgi:hypothetical protein
MEEAPENGKELSHSAHGNGMNELDMKCQQHTEFWKYSYIYIKVLCTTNILERHEQGKTLIISEPESIPICVMWCCFIHETVLAKMDIVILTET